MKPNPAKLQTKEQGMKTVILGMEMLTKTLTIDLSFYKGGSGFCFYNVKTFKWIGYLSFKSKFYLLGKRKSKIHRVLLFFEYSLQIMLKN